MTSCKESFTDKWKKNPQLVFKETLKEDSEFFAWILRRNGFRNSEEFRCFLKNKKRILDAGCGNGRITALMRKYSSSQTQIVGIDLAKSAIKAARHNLKKFKNVQFFQKDLLRDLSELGMFDLIYCQEVLHHTDNPVKAFQNLCKLLVPDGEIAIYVYKKKAPIREFVDDYIRQKITDLPYDEAMEICSQITKLGKALSEYNIKIKIPSVDVLEIKEGEYDLKRFIYHFFMKCFWNPEISFKDNSVINYDWYYPQICSRHTIEEIRSWFDNCGLKVQHEDADFYGITMRGQIS